MAGLCGRRPQRRFVPRRAGDIDLSAGAPERPAGQLGMRAGVELPDGREATLRSVAARRAPA